LGFPTGRLAPLTSTFFGTVAGEFKKKLQCQPHAIKAFFWRRCRGERGFLLGESLASNLLLCYCFAYFLYFIFVCIFLSKIKKLVPFIVGILVFLLLVHYVVP
jgi:hypothetical protein